MSTEVLLEQKTPNLPGAEATQGGSTSTCHENLDCLDGHFHIFPSASMEHLTYLHLLLCKFPSTSLVDASTETNVFSDPADLPLPPYVENSKATSMEHSTNFHVLPLKLTPISTSVEGVVAASGKGDCRESSWQSGGSTIEMPKRMHACTKPAKQHSPSANRRLIDLGVSILIRASG